MRTIIYKFFFISILVVVLFLLPHVPYHNIMVNYFRLVVIVFLFIESVSLFNLLFIQNNVSAVWKNIGLILFSFYIMLLLLEAIFSFIPRSHGDGSSMASRLWFSNYWNPINQDGFRDSEPQISDSLVLFIGDSFTSGHGINQVEDRFSDQVKLALQKSPRILWLILVILDAIVVKNITI